MSSEGPPAKKQKVEEKVEEKNVEEKEESYLFNLNLALDKAHESKSLKDIIELPPSALQGLSERADKLLAKWNVTTIKGMAEWKFFKVAKAITTLASLEEDGKRLEGSKMNINAALDKDFEKKSLKEIVKASPSAIQGLADWSDKEFADFNVKTIEAFANWKYFSWAQSLVTLADYENTDFSSK